MNIRIISLFIILILWSCDQKSPDFIIEGQIEGLKKGKLYLQKIKDSTIVNLDSLIFYNNNQFKFERQLAYPEVLYLQLKKDSTETTDNFISFFADQGTVSINAKLDQFMFAEIKGDYPNQQKFMEYSKTLKRFADQKLDLIKAEINARKNANQQKLDSINAAYNKMNQRRYLFAVNFAMAYPELEVSPYVLLNQAEFISKSYLDSVYQKFDAKIQKSYYGIKLNELLAKN